MRMELLCLTAVCCLAACSTTAVERVVAPKPMLLQPAVEVETVPLPIQKEPQAEPQPELNEAEVEMLAKLVWGEARGCSVTEQAAVIWTVLNRVDSEDPIFPDTIEGVVTQPNQFHGYDPDFPVEPEHEELARDVLKRWLTGGEGRVLPKEHLFFHGDGIHNHFRKEFQHNGQYWDWSLDSPYEEN